MLPFDPLKTLSESCSFDNELNDGGCVLLTANVVFNRPISPVGNCKLITAAVPMAESTQISSLKEQTQKKN